MADASSLDSVVAIWQGMTEGNLPRPTDGLVWGEGGTFGAAETMAATNGTVMHVYSVTGEVSALDFLLGAEIAGV